jgi:hypothetical protein
MPEGHGLIDHSLAHYWRDRRLFATSLLALYLHQYGPKEGKGSEIECLYWGPETIEMEVHDDFGVDLPQGNFERLLTAITLLTTNTFFTSPPDFTRACVVLSGHVPNPNTMLLPDCADLAWGITEALLISPPDDDDQAPFSPEILGYVGTCLDDEGILNPPDVLKIGTRSADSLNRQNYAFSDDPDMFAAVVGFERDKTQSINDLVRGRLRALLTQLSTLPVAHGKAAALAANLLAKLPAGEELPLPG